MSDPITLTIDGRTISVEPGTTLLKAARQAGIDSIPTICFHDYCTSNGLCRICVVEVEGSRTLIPSCCTKAVDGMKVQTRTPRVERARRTLLEMLSASVDLSDAPEILALMEEYGAGEDRFPAATERRYPVLDDNPMFIRDYSKCILCWRCVQVCAEDAQYTYAIQFSGRGFDSRINTFYELPSSAPPAWSAVSAWASAQPGRSNPGASGCWSRVWRWRRLSPPHAMTAN